MTSHRDFGWCAIGHTVCAGFDNEKSSVVVMRLMKDTDLSLKQSSYFVGASISAFCPQYIGQTDNSANWLNPGPRLCDHPPRAAIIAKRLTLVAAVRGISSTNSTVLGTLYPASRVFA